MKRTIILISQKWIQLASYLLLLFSFVFILGFRLSAQQSVISGHLSDSLSAFPLSNATVSLIRQSDSVLVNFVRTDNQASFAIPANPGKYILYISYPSYADYVDFINVSKDTSLGSIHMITRAVALEGVIVRASSRIKMRGDTMGFVADSFLVREGASVEELLKRLPGVTVNAKGEITAMGKKVDRVLVDGDEFFGDDPTLATKNLQAKAVKEVQVFEKKSDQAVFTGVDDGQGSQTINLKLKDEYKKGYFGKLDLGHGLPKRFEDRAMLNAFNDKRKFSVFGIGANTNNINLKWEDDNKYGGDMGSTTVVGDDGSVMSYSMGDEFSGGGSRFYGEGLPTSYTLGTSYSNKWNQKRSSVVGTYKYQNLSIEAINSNRSQYILPDTLYYVNANGIQHNNRWRNKVNVRSEVFIDSMQALTFSLGGEQSHSSTTSEYYSESLTSDSLPVNKGNRLTANDQDNVKFNFSALYKLKFKKLKRTFSANFTQSSNSQDGKGYLLNRNDFFIKGSFVKADSTDQLKINENKGLNLSSKIAYTEPVGKNGILEFSYGLGLNNSKQKLLSYDQENGKYENLNDTFSNNFKFKTISHQLGTGYRYQKGDFNYGVRGRLVFNDWNQDNLFADTASHYNFTNFFGGGDVGYKFSKYSRVQFSYNASTQAPNINQLQPVANNNDPLNIQLGNPDLKQSFTHSFQLNFNDYQVLTQRDVYGYINFNTTSNAFSNITRIDSIGRRITQTINVNGNYSLYGFFGGGLKFNERLEGRMEVVPTLLRNISFVNGVRNVNNSSALSFAPNLSLYKENKYYHSIRFSLNFNKSTSSIQPDIATKYYTLEFGYDLNYELPKSFRINTDISYNYRQKTDVFPENNNVFIWNVGLNKKINKKRDLELGLSINDIFNQNLGFDRNINSNFISESTYNVIQRYWLLKLVWNFNNGPKSGDF